ncbi:uncharacterized protein LOC132266708 [Cornus florida]|uniref:uncharacterized protein LOC132266708 n=1 Tax=Cornus florida TaxID=4283 RepID=UPI0028A01202|nr:uncharacterized protein LOC132266708 [Cornus florida]
MAGQPYPNKNIHFLVSGEVAPGFCPGSPPLCVVCVFVFLLPSSFLLLAPGISISYAKQLRATIATDHAKATIHLQLSGRGEGGVEELRNVEILPQPHFIHEFGGYANPFFKTPRVVKETHQRLSSDLQRLQLHWYNCYSCQSFVLIHSS